MTINSTTPSTAAVIHAVTGGKFRLRLEDANAMPGRRHAQVLDDHGNVIGSASDYIYGGSGYAVHTVPFGGYVPESQIVYVP